MSVLVCFFDLTVVVDVELGLCDWLDRAKTVYGKLPKEELIMSGAFAVLFGKFREPPFSSFDFTTTLRTIGGIGPEVMILH